MKKAALIIMDGWGIGDGSESDTVDRANTPFIDSLYKNNPNATLKTFGAHVGLPDGQMGNSEVGHLNIGAGRIVYQDLAKINKAIEDGTLAENETLLAAFDYAKKENKPVHVMGLVSNGGIHSKQDHLHHLLGLAENNGIKNLFVHAFTDGRDTNPTMGKGYIENLVEFIDGKNAKLASLVGRYYAMDRDNRWERISLGYELLVNGVGEKITDFVGAVQQSYDNNITDEFIKPVVGVDESGEPIATISAGDVVICFNFRTDRCRQITQALTQEDFPDHNMKTIDLHYVTMTNYNSKFKNIHLIFDKDNIKMTLGEAISIQGKTQLRIAETEKYPHVTFFFSGGRELEFEGEIRRVAPSPKVASYDEQPEMSIHEVTAMAVKEINDTAPDFICLNFANPDMVGHTGNQPAIIKACEATDDAVSQVVEAGRAKGYSFVIIADHGNAEFSINADGSPNTAHTVNLVPVFLIDDDYTQISDGKLADLAPSILTIMGLEIPEEMTGNVIIDKL
ncbi:MAG: 2,3-bisphosphoglycerate-independent phosphoglycerate mutase [Flavobacteriales bacterium]|nr:2,3-bisphosphoglycerate-independent phosphoglycerate mutase [Flavobacteriales bacterium]